MDQTDFVIIIVGGVLIIVAIFLFILYRIFEIKKKNRPVVNLLPEITKIDRDESQPEKFVIQHQEIEGLEKRFQKARDFQKNEPDIQIVMEKKKDMPSNEPEKQIVPSKETVQIQKDTKEEPLTGSTGPIKEEKVFQDSMQSFEENEKLKLEDILIHSFINHY